LQLSKPEILRIAGENMLNLQKTANRLLIFPMTKQRLTGLGSLMPEVENELAGF